MSQSQFIAHVHPCDKAVQSVFTHLTETAMIARLLAGKLDLADAGELLGLMHDFGKYSSAFQKYIASATGLINPDNDDFVAPNGKKTDHSTAGAKWVYENMCRLNEVLTNQNGAKFELHWGELFGQILSLCIASHHGAGLIDCLDEEGDNTWCKRVKEKPDAETHYQECIERADEAILTRAEALIKPAGNALKNVLKPSLLPLLKSTSTTLPSEEFELGCFTRFLFSCLIDADRINSADFERENQKEIRNLHNKPDWQTAINRLETHLNQWQVKYPIDQIRKNISDTCQQRGQNDTQNIYTLTVPTGGGKTLSSLRYALHHAQKHQLDRIIYIIPYTSIIEQNAQAIRDILGDDWVLEHHANLDPEQQTWQNKLLSQNWDKPIVLTTMVQFLNAWFTGGTGSVRHLHAMTRSVLIFDEIQTLPIKCVHLFCHVLNWLAAYGKSTAILCTATQPVLDKLPQSTLRGLRLPENAEIMENVPQLFQDLKRVHVQFNKKLQGWSLAEAGDFLLSQFQTHDSCLFIVNTKKWAKDLYQYCQEKDIPQDALFHLSTHQCPAHRQAIFAQMKARLHAKLPVVCISTQLIEAGVDISMKCVIRALAGLDSIAQAAGRCNRHGELSDGQLGTVWVLNLQEPQALEKFLPEMAEGQRQANREEFERKDVLLPESLINYFNYYFYQRANQMVYPLKETGGDNLFNWLSNNPRNANASKNNHRANRIPLLMQSFKRAGKAFQVIDAPTRALIVPYGEGRNLIEQLLGEWDAKAFYHTLRKAQRYSVSVFPHFFNQLCEQGVIREIHQTGIYYLDFTTENHYSDEYGLSLDGLGEMAYFDL